MDTKYLAMDRSKLQFCTRTDMKLTKEELKQLFDLIKSGEVTEGNLDIVFEYSRCCHCRGLTQLTDAYFRIASRELGLVTFCEFVKKELKNG